MNHRTLILAVGLLRPTGRLAQAEIQVAVRHNANEAAVPGFKFKNLPSPKGNNAARSARFTLVAGTVDDNSGGLDTLQDGRLPDAEVQPRRFYFSGRAPIGGGWKLIWAGCSA